MDQIERDAKVATYGDVLNKAVVMASRVSLDYAIAEHVFAVEIAGGEDAFRQLSAIRQGIKTATDGAAKNEARAAYQASRDAAIQAYIEAE